MLLKKRYFIVGMRPVSIAWYSTSEMGVEKYDWEKQIFVPGKEYITPILFGRGEILEVDENKFQKETEEVKREIEYKVIERKHAKNKIRRNGDFKARWRAEEKAQEDFGGHFECVLDIISMDIICESYEQIQKEMIHIKNDPRVMRIMDRFANPLPCGYSDIIVNSELSNGHISETRIHLADVYKELYAVHNHIVDHQILPIIEFELKQETMLIRKETSYEINSAFKRLRALYESIKHFA